MRYGALIDRYGLLKRVCTVPARLRARYASLAGQRRLRGLAADCVVRVLADHWRCDPSDLGLLAVVHPRGDRAPDHVHVEVLVVGATWDGRSWHPRCLWTPPEVQERLAAEWSFMLSADAGEPLTVIPPEASYVPAGRTRKLRHRLRYAVRTWPGCAQAAPAGHGYLAASQIGAARASVPVAPRPASSGMSADEHQAEAQRASAAIEEMGSAPPVDAAQIEPSPEVEPDRWQRIARRPLLHPTWCGRRTGRPWYAVRFEYADGSVWTRDGGVWRCERPPGPQAVPS